MKHLISISRFSLFLSVITIYSSCGNMQRVTQESPIKKPTSLVGKIVDDNDSLPVLDSEPIIVYEKMSFGSGYNSATGHEFFSVMQYEGVEENTEIVSGATGNSGFISIHSTSVKDSLRKVLDITKNASIKAKFGKIGGGSASYKERKFEETRFGSLNQVAVVKAQYVNEPRIILNPNLREELIDLARNSEKEFMHTAGDMFVSKIFTGGSLYGIFNLKEENSYQKKKNDLFIKASGNYLGISVKGSIDIKKTSEIFKEISKIDVTYITEGGADSIGDINNLDGFLDGAKIFKKQVSIGNGNPIIIYVQLEPYENMAGFPKNFDFSPIRVNQKAFLNKCQEILYDIEYSKENIDHVLKYQTNYALKDVQKARELKPSFRDREIKLQKAYNKSVADFEYEDYKILKEVSKNLPFKPELTTPITFYQKSFLDLNKPNLIINNTGASGKILHIGGQIAALKEGEEDEKLLKANYKHFDTKYRTGLGLYKFYRQYTPYFKITYKDANSEIVIKEINHKGDSLILPSNISVNIELMNPQTSYHDYRGRVKKSSGNLYRNIRYLDRERPFIEIFEKSKFKNINDENISRHYRHPKDFETYIICEDETGFLVVLPGGAHQTDGHGNTLQEVRNFHGLPMAPFKIERHEESCGNKW